MGTSYYCSFLGTRGLEIHDGIRASAGKMSAGLKLKAEPPHELLCNQESEGAWDEEHRDGNSSSRKNHFLRSKSQEEQEAKNLLSALEVLPLTPLRCGVREELILMSLGLAHQGSVFGQSDQRGRCQRYLVLGKRPLQRGGFQTPPLRFHLA